MDQLDWKILSLIAITNSASRVAEQLFMSQPAVTYRLKKIEDEFQSDLFLRTNKGVTLTEAGKVLSSFADPMLDKFKEISISVNVKKALKDTLSIGVPYTLCGFVIDILKDFENQCPDLRVHFYTNTSINIVKRFKDGELSTAFIRGIYGGADNVVTLFKDPIRIISKRPLTIESLGSFPFIDFDTTSIQRHLFNLWAANNDVTLKDIYYAGKIYACLKMVEAGLGWSVVNSQILTEMKIKGLHIYLPRTLSGEPLYVNTQYLYSPDTASNEVKLFSDFVLDDERIKRKNLLLSELPQEELK